MTTIKVYDIASQDFTYAKSNGTGLIMDLSSFTFSGGALQIGGNVNATLTGSVGDASAANQLVQIADGSNSNVAVCGRLDTLATSAKQDSMLSDLDSIDNKLSLIATEATLSTLTGRIVICDTSNLSTAANQTSANGLLTGIESNIGLLLSLADNGGGLRTVNYGYNVLDSNQTMPLQLNSSNLLVQDNTVHSELANISTKTDLLALDSTLSTLSGKISSCDTSFLATELTLAALDAKITVCDTSSLASQTTLSALNDKVTGTLDTSGLATETTLSALNTKVTGSLDTSGLATETTLAALDAKITICDTSSLATEASLASIDGKITAVNTGACVISSGTVNAQTRDGAGTSIGSYYDGVADLSGLAVYVMNPADSLARNLVYAYDGAANQRVSCNGSGYINTLVNNTVTVTASNASPVIVSPRNVYVEQVLATTNVTGSTVVGTAVDTQDYETVGVFVGVPSCSVGGSIFLEFSVDNVNWARGTESLFIAMSGSAANYALKTAKMPFRYLRLYADSPLDAVNVSAWFTMK